MNWENSIDLFKRYLKLEKNLSKNTLIAYIQDITKLGNYSKSLNSNPINIEEQEIRQFIYELYSCGKYSERTQARTISSLKHFFYFLNLEDLREDNPTEKIESPKLGFYIPDYLTLEEIENIILQIDLSSEQGHRNKAIIELLYGTGIRVTELINLKLENIFKDEEVILINGKGNKQRLVPIAKQTLNYLEIYINHTRNNQKIDKKFESFVFLNRRGKSLTRNMIFIIIQDLKNKANITKNVSPHTFRHSFASHLLQNGADIRFIQLLLGHESITTTEIYTHIPKKQLYETLLKHHPRYAK